MQVPQAVVAQAQLGLVQPSSDGTVTLPGPDGKPVKIPQAALATATSTVFPNMTAGKQYCQGQTPKNCHAISKHRKPSSSTIPFKK